MDGLITVLAVARGLSEINTRFGSPKAPRRAASAYRLLTVVKAGDYPAPAFNSMGGGNRLVKMGIRPKITLRGFKPGARGAARVLGALETAVMEILWREPGLSVSQVEERLRRRREIAHTTVLTTLDRMHRKGYLTREKRGKAFIYSSRYTREEFEHGLAQEVLSSLLGQFTEPAISTFVDLVARDEGALDQLETLIREKKREQERTRKR
jgi:predicted transcriptional regulator